MIETRDIDRAQIPGALRSTSLLSLVSCLKHIRMNVFFHYIVLSLPSLSVEKLVHNPSHFYYQLKSQ